MKPDDLMADLQKPWRHGEHVDARGAVFDEPVVLDGKTVRGFDLSDAQFRYGFSARSATFLGLAWLLDARIDGTFDLTGATFRIDLRAEGMKANTLFLEKIQVRGVLALARIQAENVALSDALVMANLTLEDARVRGAVDLSRAEIMGGLWTTGAQLGHLVQDGTVIFGRISRSG